MAASDAIQIGIGDLFSVAIHYTINNAGFITGVIFGLTIGAGYHWLIGYRALKRSFDKSIKDKDRLIEKYEFVVFKELEKITVPEINKEFFKRLKKFFRGRIAVKITKVNHR